MSELERLRAINAELYAALEAVRPYFEGEHHPDHPHCRQLQAALAKAREPYSAWAKYRPEDAP